MAYDPEAGGEPPEFRQAYVKQMLGTIVDNSRQEFRAIWTCNKHGIPKVEASRRMSIQINRVKDSFEQHHASMSETERDCLTRSVLRKGAVPPVMLERLGLEGVLRNVPANYVLSMVSAWIASRYVYRYGLDASEVSFFLFLRELMEPGGSEESRSASEAERSRASGEEPQQRSQDAALAAAGVGAAPAPPPSPADAWPVPAPEPEKRTRSGKPPLAFPPSPGQSPRHTSPDSVMDTLSTSFLRSCSTDALKMPEEAPERPAARRRTLDGYGQFLFLDDDAKEPCALGPGLPQIPRERAHTA